MITTQRNITGITLWTIFPANKNPPDFNELEHFKQQTTKLQYMLIINRMLSCVGVSYCYSYHSWWERALIFISHTIVSPVCFIPHLDGWIWAAGTPAHYGLTLTKTDKEKHFMMRVKQAAMVVRGGSSDSQYWPDWGRGGWCCRWPFWWGCWEENCFLWAMSWGHLMEENMWTLIELYHLYQSISNQEHVDL